MLLTPAELTWRDGKPYANRYDDLFYTDHSNDGGISDVRDFFVNPSGLLDRATEQTWLTVGELGFGTGLNFAVTAQDILDHTNAHLHFVSVEAHPLSYDDWQQLARARPRLQLAQHLADHPLPLLPGWHHRIFAQGRIRLSVFHGDVMAAWQDWQASSSTGIDAWFLDGFAPDRNANMWTSDLCELLADCSAHQATVSTFTASGRVRRALQSAGFTVHKESRAPLKREALVAQIQGPRASVQLPQQISVAGAGLGGCSMARTLADMGIAVRLFDPAGIAQANRVEGASRIAQAVLHGRMLGHQGPEASIRAHAFHFARQFVDTRPGFRPTGVVQLQGPNMDAVKLDRIVATYAAKDPEQHWWLECLAARDLSALGLQPALGDALWFPRGGVMDLPTYCNALADHPLIEFVAESRETSNGPLVSCTGAFIRRRFPNLELAQIAGQLDHYRYTGATPTVPVVGNGYCVPEPAIGQVTLGATYEYQPWTGEKAETHNRRINESLIDLSACKWSHTTRGIRTVASDRLPIIGQLEDKHWVATGFASMGTTMAAYAAALVSAELAGWAPPATARERASLRPQRFVERQARRGLRQGALEPPP